MPRFRWKEEYSLCLPDMDAQHQEIFAGFAELEDAVGSEATVKQLAGLIRGAQTLGVPLRHRGRMLDAVGFPGLVQQRVQHRLFVNRLRAVEGSLTRNEAKLTLEQVHALQSWIMGHVVGLDREYADFLEARGGAAE